MILVLRKSTANDHVLAVLERLQAMGLRAQAAPGGHGTVVVIEQDVSTYPSHLFSQLPGVEKVLRLHAQSTLALTLEPQPIVLANGIRLGNRPIIAAGPCSVESEAQIIEAAHKVKDAGATLLRGGAFKPRTSPYDFQGLGLEGLRLLDVARKQTGLPVVSEVMTPEHVELALPYIDILQIGARNMYNYELLKECGRANVPVLLKRGLSATVTEWLNSAEYILNLGNEKVILCERGIRTFETATRNTLDLSVVPLLKSMCSLPVIVDPSHGTGRPELVRAMSRAAIACGADGLLIEVHERPECALSDGDQAISSSELAAIAADCQKIWALLAGMAADSFCAPTAGMAAAARI